MAERIANVDMAKAWDGDEGEDWARDWEAYDRAARVHHEALMAAAAVAPGERVLDLGCGNGQVARTAAAASGDGAVLGLDLSSQMLERARDLAKTAQLSNVEFVQGDAQVYEFDRSSYDVALSRFGLMFFADPVAAFTNIGSALRPGGRLATVSWRGLDANEWLRSLLGALAAGRPMPAPPSDAPGPMGLSDPDRVRTLLTSAGFTDIVVEPVDGPVCLGLDAESAYRFFASSGVTRGMLHEADEATRKRALDDARSVMAAHETSDGVLFGSGSWLTTARWAR
jgi:SAM-dependent methyltransferase